MKKYYIDYSTGAGNEWIEVNNIDEAKKYVEENVTYTQSSVFIMEDGEEAACLKWYGCSPCEDDEVAVQFGDFGFYTWL